VPMTKHEDKVITAPFLSTLASSMSPRAQRQAWMPGCGRQLGRSVQSSNRMSRKDMKHKLPESELAPSTIGMLIASEQVK